MLTITKVNPVSFLLAEGGLTYGLTFFGSDRFRFFDVDAPKSEVAHCPSYDGAVSYEPIDGGVRLQTESLIVEIGSGFSLRVSRDGKTLFDGAFGDGSSGGDAGLAQKEGHASSSEGYSHRFGFRNDRPIYGLGERTGPLDKRGYSYFDWNTDDPSAHVDTFPALYQSLPFFICFSPVYSVGVYFDNTTKIGFDFQKEDPNRISLGWNLGVLDLYLWFAPLGEVVAGFTTLVGRPFLPPYWALGAQQCRWSYPSAAAVDEVINGYDEAGIPLSAVYLDIDYMDGYMDFTVNEGTFPAIREWLAAKKAQNIRVIPIIDAGIKAKPGYFMYDEGLKEGYFSTLNGEVYHNEVWPGDSVFPAFYDTKVRQWWSHHIAAFLDLGFSGIWNDMNEPASFKGPLPEEVDMGGKPHSYVHNVYGHYMVKAGYEGFLLAGKRPFQLTRAGFAGTSAFSASWAGDNQSIYDHLRLSLPQLMNMSLSGQSYVGVDIGGFGGDTTPELLTRWAVAALFSPLYRNHSALGTKDQEPYRLSEPYLSAYREAVLWRYRLLPVLYDCLYQAEANGQPVLRPLVFNYPEDERLANENTEIMLGRDFLLAPSLFPGQQKRHVYLPASFYHLPSGVFYEKGDYLIDVGIGDMPLFFAASGLSVIAPKDQLEAKRSETLMILWGGEDAQIEHYEDEGDGLSYKQGAFNLYSIRAKKGEAVEISLLHHGYESQYCRYVLLTPKGEIASGEFPKQGVIRIELKK